MTRRPVVVLGLVVTAGLTAGLCLASCTVRVSSRPSTTPAPRALVSITPSPVPAGPQLYARADLTPGSLNPQVTEQTLASTICKAGWTDTVRSVPDSVRAAVLAAYGLPAGPFAGELDHLVPLSLGGSNDRANLWPEPGSIPNPKDTVEGALRRSVCSGSMRLATAQQLVVAAYVR